MGEHVDHACDLQRLAGVDAHDAALGDGRGDDAAISEIGTLNSPAYFAAPVTLARPSMRDVAVPI